MEQTIMQEAFGSSPFVRAFEFFWEFSEFAYSFTDVMRETNMSYPTLKRIWPELVKLGFIVSVGKQGRAVKYRINMESKLVHQMHEFLKETLHKDFSVSFPDEAAK